MISKKERVLVGKKMIYKVKCKINIKNLMILEVIKKNMNLKK